RHGGRTSALLEQLAHVLSSKETLHAGGIPRVGTAGRIQDREGRTRADAAASLRWRHMEGRGDGSTGGGGRRTSGPLSAMILKRGDVALTGLAQQSPQSHFYPPYFSPMLSFV